MNFGKWAADKINNFFYFLATRNLAIVCHICVSFINSCLTQMRDIWEKLVFVAHSACSWLLLKKRGVRSKAWRGRRQKHFSSLQWGGKGLQMVEKRKNWAVGGVRQGGMFLLLGIEQVWAGKAFSTMFTFEENSSKRFTGLSLGHPNTPPGEWGERKWKPVWNRNVHFCLKSVSSLRKLVCLLLRMYFTE